MYKYANDKESIQSFYEIVEKTWKEKFGNEAMNEIYRGDESHKIILMNEKEQYTGTFEFIPYHPCTSKMEFDFHTIDCIKQSTNVVEIDKFTISKEFASLSIFGEAILTMMDYVIDNDVEYYVHCIQPDLMKVLIGRYGFPIERVGDDIIVRDSDGNVLGKEIPTIIRTGYAREHLDEFPRVKRLFDRRKTLVNP